MSDKQLARIEAFKDLGLGVFVHWGLYSLSGRGEWSRRIHQIPQASYEKAILNFDASEFDAKALVQAAKAMGANYMTLTTKHHEGMFLYDTRGLSRFDSLHSKAKRDLVAEFVSACHEAGIKPFLYMATFDWHSPLFESDFPAFLTYLKDSVEILCRHYGEIGGFWFDGNWSRPEADWQLDELYGMIRTLQPNAMIINNTGLDDRGSVVHDLVDAVTFEKGTPETIKSLQDDLSQPLAGEICDTINYHWGYAVNDLNFKSFPDLLTAFCYARRMGMNYLLNVSPEGSGHLPSIYQDYMQLFGKWLAVFGQAVYQPRPSQAYTKSNPQDFVLEDDDYLYFFIHDLPVVGDSNVVLRGDAVNPRSFIQVTSAVEDLVWLDNQERLTFDYQANKKLLTMDATGFSYGEHWVIRVARAKKIS